MVKAKSAPAPAGKEIQVSMMVPLDLSPPAGAPPAPATDSRLDGLGDPSADVADMLPHWEPIQAVLGGTPGMRKAGEKWLPAEKHEKSADYIKRSDVSILFNFFADAVTKAVAKPFAKDVMIKPEDSELPEALVPILDNADRQGHNLTAFARLLFREAVTYGSAHVMVDVPPKPEQMTDEQARQLDVQQQLDLRPYFTIISGPNLIGWIDDEQGNCLVARVREWHVVRTGWKEERVEHVRLWQAAHAEFSDTGEAFLVPAGWVLYRKNGGGWTPVKVGTVTYPGPGLPLVSLVLEPTAKRIGYAPFEDVAWITVSYWQGYSDYRNILRFVSVGILLLKGITSEETNGAVVVAGNHGIRTANSDADAKYVEHSGAAIGSLKEALQDMQARVDVASLHPMIDSVGQATATGRSIDEGKSLCSLQAWARSAEMALRSCFEVAATWVDEELPEDFAIDIPDFTLSLRSAQNVQALIALCNAHKIDKRTLLVELKKLGVLSDDANIDDILNALAEEGPPLGMLGYGQEPPTPGAPEPPEPPQPITGQPPDVQQPTTGERYAA